MKTLSITAEIVVRLQATAITAYPEEACGLLLGKWNAEGQLAASQVVVVPNSAACEERRHRYTIAPRLLLEWERIAQRSGLAIIGFFHSHPDHPPVPSATDVSLAWPGYAYAIVSVRKPAASGDGRPWVSGMAAWTFVEASASFAEIPVTVEVADDEIEYFI